MSDAEKLLAAGILTGIALLSGDERLIRLCEIVFCRTPPKQERPSKVIEWIR